MAPSLASLVKFGSSPKKDNHCENKAALFSLLCKLIHAQIVQRYTIGIKLNVFKRAITMVFSIYFGLFEDETMA